MSYILDAVKKAEAERERDRTRGAVPGPNSQQTAGVRRVDYPQQNRNAMWMAIVAVLVALAIAVAAWAWRSGASSAAAGPTVVVAAPVVAPPVVSAVTATAAATTTAAIAAPLAPPPVLAPVPAPVPALVPAPVTAASAVEPRPAMQGTRTTLLAALPPKIEAPVNKVTAPDAIKPAAKAAPPALPVKPLPGATAAATAQAPALPAAASSSRLPSAAAGRTGTGGQPGLNDLPDDIRSQIPPLRISGAAYSEATKEWVLLVNDQVRAAGSMLAPDLRLEEVVESGAVFSFKGQRFRVDR
jgi:general secretion pathway protein B